MPEERAAKRKSQCTAVHGGCWGRSKERENGIQKRPGAEAALPAGCNQTRVNRLFHRWLIRRILDLFPCCRRSLSLCAGDDGAVPLSHILNSDAFVSSV